MNKKKETKVKLKTYNPLWFYLCVTFPFHLICVCERMMNQNAVRIFHFHKSFILIYFCNFVFLNSKIKLWQFYFYYFVILMTNGNECIYIYIHIYIEILEKVGNGSNWDLNLRNSTSILSIISTSILFSFCLSNYV